MSISNTVSGKIPPDYKEAFYWKVSDRVDRIVIMNLVSIPLALVFGIGFYIFVRMFGKPQEFEEVMLGDSSYYLLFIVGIVVVFVLHEFVHGIAMQFFGAQTKYGFIWKGFMFYATSSGYAFQRNQYVVAALAPLVGLSILACCGILVLAGTSTVWLLAIWATINGSAAIGDLWITVIVLSYPSYAYVVDERDGVRIFMPQNEADV